MTRLFGLSGSGTPPACVEQPGLATVGTMELAGSD